MNARITGDVLVLSRHSFIDDVATQDLWWLCIEIPDPSRLKGSREGPCDVFHEEPRVFPQPRSEAISVRPLADASGDGATLELGAGSGSRMSADVFMSTAMREHRAASALAPRKTAAFTTARAHPRVATW